MKILIAEDEPVSRLCLRAQLARWGYEVVVTEDGLAAWEALQAGDSPSLAILDWMMPGLDGTEVCRRLRQRAAEPYVYVILLTGRGDTRDVVEGLSAGADDYLAKPFEASELEVRLRVGRRIVDLQAELVSAREALRFQATHDALTGAFNRAAVMQALQVEAVRAGRERLPLAVAMIDLDHFKAVNDGHGHGGGDAVLREVARRATAVVRGYDVLARYGGEEFLVLLPACDQERATAVGERLREAVAGAPVIFEGQAIAVTCSVGVAVAVTGEMPGDLIARADAALYRAKRSGRNRVVLASTAERSLPPREGRPLAVVGDGA